LNPDLDCIIGAALIIRRLKGPYEVVERYPYANHTRGIKYYIDLTPTNPSSDTIILNHHDGGQKYLSTSSLIEEKIETAPEELGLPKSSKKLSEVERKFVVAARLCDTQMVSLNDIEYLTLNHFALIMRRVTSVTKIVWLFVKQMEYMETLQASYDEIAGSHDVLNSSPKIVFIQGVRAPPFVSYDVTKADIVIYASKSGKMVTVGRNPKYYILEEALSRGYDLTETVLPKLLELEEGWGGRPEVIGSPKPGGTSLSLEKIKEVVVKEVGK